MKAARLALRSRHDLKVAGRGPARADHPHAVPTRWRRLSEGGGIHPVLVSHARVRHLVVHSADRYLDRAPSLEPGHRPTHSITRLFVRELWARVQSRQTRRECAFEIRERLARHLRVRLRERGPASGLFEGADEAIAR